MVFIVVIWKHLRVEEVHGVCSERKGICATTMTWLVFVVGSDPGVGQAKGLGLTTTLVSQNERERATD